ncbi:MAG TPA: hypothetical protein VKY59_02620 [Spirillospora sp.]|nr:hypothetical protein [Spirillospora sp.]
MLNRLSPSTRGCRVVQTRAIMQASSPVRRPPVSAAGYYRLAVVIVGA